MMSDDNLVWNFKLNGRVHSLIRTDAQIGDRDLPPPNQGGVTNANESRDWCYIKAQ